MATTLTCASVDLHTVIETDPPLQVVIEPASDFTTTIENQQGPAGPPGAGGSGSGYYRHEQPIASAEWIMNHNFGYRPNASVFSLGGMEMWAEFLHFSDNQTRVYFDAPVAGYGICS